MMRQKELEEVRTQLAAEKDSVRVLTVSAREAKEEADMLRIRLTSAPHSRDAIASTGDGVATSSARDAWEEGGGEGSPSTALAATLAAGDTMASRLQGVDGRDRERVAENIEPNNDAVRAQQGRGRFYLQLKPTIGYTLIYGERRSAKQLLARLGMTEFLKKAQRSKPNQCRDALLLKLSHLLGLLLVEEEERAALAEHAATLQQNLTALGRINDALLGQLEAEQIARRHTVVGYVRAIKSQAITQSALSTSVAALARLSGMLGSGTAPLRDSTEGPLGVTIADAQPNARPATSIIRLDSCCVGDEEAHALAAVLRDENVDSLPWVPASSSMSPTSPARVSQHVQGITVVSELHMRDNHICDDGVASIATLLEQPKCAIRLVNLRGNHISMTGLQRLAEALERNTDVSSVLV
ncbi:MAG: hypothetical protein EOO65_03915, partial [Methanosarcinales archaeon]